MDHPTPTSPSSANHSNDQIELAKLQLARDQFEYEKTKSGRLTTSQIALLGSLLSVASGIAGAAITGWFSKQSEEVKSQAGVGIEEIKGGTSINLEKLKFETGLVIQAIKTDDQEKAVKTLKFFANAGLIPTFEKRVLTLAETDNGSGIPALEAIEIGGPTKISDVAKSALLSNLEKYRDYMRQIGYQIPATKLNIKFDPEAATSNAYYEASENSIVMDPRLVGDSQTMYHAYTIHVLNAVNPKAWNIANIIVTALHEALADYLTCSYEGTSKLGVKFVQSVAKDLPSDMVQLGYLRNLQSTSKIVSETETDPFKTEPHKAGEAWAAALWEIRATLGCSPDVAQCERADKILLATWASPWLDQASSSKTAGQRFAQAIIEAIAGAGTAEEAKQARSIFQRRGLELP